MGCDTKRTVLASSARNAPATGIAIGKHIAESLITTENSAAEVILARVVEAAGDVLDTDAKAALENLIKGMESPGEKIKIVLESEFAKTDPSMTEINVRITALIEDAEILSCEDMADI